uniref:TAFII55 protein conserved region domain-containing protein n=1 Tax=Compsopogon caeruleus TaxID=31354 RepID=A0A7S1XGZ9_9RHOD|mmetsp:Transcript_7358/g.15031  ORF Transcript_7358/g.15031 Transcript_7358/m.15031 type:complete len:350 (+) Transcript_7358:521-1570(+)
MEEQQFLIRLPPLLADKMRSALSSKRKGKESGEETESTMCGRFDLHFVSERVAEVVVDGKERYRGVLKDLPAICETNKTADRRNLYKSGEVAQVLVVDGEALADGIEVDRVVREGEVFELEDGLTPGARKARSRMALPPPLYPQEVITNVEDQMKFLLDNKIVFVRKQGREEDLVVEAEDDGPSVLSPEPPGRSQGSGRPHKVARIAGSDVTSRQQPSGSVHSPEPLQSPTPATPSGFGMSPSPAQSPMPVPSPSSAMDDASADIDDFADMLVADVAQDDARDDELSEAKRTLERDRLEKAIAAQRKVVDGLELQVSKAPNPIMKKRFESKLEDAMKELKKREDELSEI